MAVWGLVVTGAGVIRRATVAAVTIVAAVAGTVSYVHAWTVVSAAGEPGAVARIYPLTVDGLIFAASMVLMDAARRRVPSPSLARWALAVGIAATVAANVAAGAEHGLAGAVVAAWPAPALVLSYELLMHLVRASSAPVTAAADVPSAPVPAPSAPADVPPAAANGHGGPVRAAAVAALTAAEQRYAPGDPLPSLRQIQRDMHVGPARARVIRGHLAALTAPVTGPDSPAGTPERKHS